VLVRKIGEWEIFRVCRSAVKIKGVGAIWESEESGDCKVRGPCRKVVGGICRKGK